MSMRCWRINTDSEARDDLRTCDRWYKYGAAITGDFAGSNKRHDTALLRLSYGDGRGPRGCRREDGFGRQVVDRGSTGPP